MGWIISGVTFFVFGCSIVVVAANMLSSQIGQHEAMMDLAYRSFYEN